MQRNRRLVRMQTSPRKYLEVKREDREGGSRAEPLGALPVKVTAFKILLRTEGPLTSVLGSLSIKKSYNLFGTGGLKHGNIKVDGRHYFLTMVTTVQV